jgi:hypothetical protein
MGKTRSKPNASQTYNERAASSGKVAMTVRISPEARAILDEESSARGVTRTQLLEDLVLDLRRIARH